MQNQQVSHIQEGKAGTFTAFTLYLESAKEGR